MEIEIKLEPDRKEPKLVLYTGEITPEVEALCRMLGQAGKKIPAWRGGQVFLLDQERVRDFYAEGGKVFAVAHGEKAPYQVRSRLYELEERLSGSSFLRVSHAQIVNFHMVESLDMSVSGTITLRYEGGGTAFVSRRYVNRIKSYLGL